MYLERPCTLQRICCKKNLQQSPPVWGWMQKVNSLGSSGITVSLLCHFLKGLLAPLSQTSGRGPSHKQNGKHLCCKWPPNHTAVKPPAVGFIIISATLEALSYSHISYSTSCQISHEIQKQTCYLQYTANLIFLVCHYSRSTVRLQSWIHIKTKRRHPKFCRLEFQAVQMLTEIP